MVVFYNKRTGQIIYEIDSWIPMKILAPEVPVNDPTYSEEIVKACVDVIKTNNCYPIICFDKTALGEIYTNLDSETDVDSIIS